MVFVTPRLISEVYMDLGYTMNHVSSYYTSPLDLSILGNVVLLVNQNHDIEPVVYMGRYSFNLLRLSRVIWWQEKY